MSNGNRNHVYVNYINHSLFPEQCYNSAMHVWIIAVNAKQMDQIIPTI